MEKWQDSDASCVGISDTKEHPQKYITLEEVVDETMLLLSRYVLNTTEEILVFTDLDAKHLKRSMSYLRRTYPYSRNIS
jgi:phosphoribosyl-dephospho-CoA transferase